MQVNATYCGNGKQALTLVAIELRAKSVRRIVVPDFHCQTMLTPFQLEGFDVQLCATDGCGALDVDALDGLAPGDDAAILVCETFGIAPPSRLVTALNRMRERGVSVVVDVTHSWLTPRGRNSYADYQVASVRKTVRTPDGGVVWGLREAANLKPTPAHDRAVALAGIAHGPHANFAARLQALDAAESAIELDLAPAPPCPQTLDLLGGLNPSALRHKLHNEAKPLVAALHGLGADVVNPDSTECGITIRVDDAAGLERALLAREIICPISWPRPGHLPHSQHWRNDLVTLPPGCQDKLAGLEPLLSGPHQPKKSGPTRADWDRLTAVAPDPPDLDIMSDSWR